MSKRILSVLCALAMLATMVVVSAFTASAAATEIDFLSSANIGNWTITREVENQTWGLFAGAVDLSTWVDTSGSTTDGETWATIGSPDINGALIFGKHNVGDPDTTKWVDFQYGTAVDFGTDFEIDMTAMMFSNFNNTTVTATDNYASLVLGNMEVRMVRYGTSAPAPYNEDQNSANSWFNHNTYRIAVYFNDTLAAVSDGFVPAKVDSPALYSTIKTPARLTTASSQLNRWIRSQLYTGGDHTTAQSDGDITFTQGGAWKDLKIVVNKGSLSVINVNGTAITLGGASSLTIPAGVSFNDVAPKIRLAKNKKMVSNYPMACFQLKATINEVTSGGYAVVDAQGGVASDASIDLDAEGYPISLPTAEKEMAEFDGWYTAPAPGGVKVTGSTQLTTGDTIYAHWTDMSDSWFPWVKASNTTSTGTYGTFSSTNLPHSFYGFYSDNTAVSSLGTYSMDSFDVEFKFWFARSSTAGRTWFTFTAGDLAVTFADAGGWGSYTASAAYGGSDLSLSATAIDTGNYYATVTADLLDELNAATGQSYQNYQFQNGYRVRITYKAGTLTIACPDKAFSATATEAMTFDNAPVSLTIGHNYSAGILGVITDFKGTYVASAAPAPAYLTPVGAGLTLDGSEDKNTAISFVYDKAEVDTEFAGLADPYCAAVLDGQNYELPLTTATFNSTEYYVATLEKVTPNLFGTKVSCQLTNGYDVTGDAFAYSVKDYCASMISGSTASAELKAVCANLLVYGEAARVYVGSPADSITAGVDVSAAVTAHADGAAIGASGTGLSFTSATVNMRDNISLVVNVADSAALAGYQLVCQPASGDTYRLTYTAATVSGGVAKYVIPVGIVNAYTEYNVYLFDGADVVSKEYQLSIAGLCTYIEEDVTDSYSAADEALAASILNLATAVAAL